jgi:hypothetical protein
MWSRVQAGFLFVKDKWYIQAGRPAATIHILRIGATAPILVPHSLDGSDAPLVEIVRDDLIRIKPHEFQVVELWQT